MNQNTRQPGGIFAHPCRGSQQQRGSASSAALCTKAVGVINKITSADDAIKLVQVCSCRKPPFSCSSKTVVDILVFLFVACAAREYCFCFRLCHRHRSGNTTPSSPPHLSYPSLHECEAHFNCDQPEELLVALEKRWLQTGSPNQLTVLFTAGPGHPPGNLTLQRTKA